MTNVWAQVDRFNDGDQVDAETLNTPVDQLASRTEYLKRRLKAVSESGYQSSLILEDVALKYASGTPNAGDIVYRGAEGFDRAQARMHLYDDFTASDSAFTLGVLISVDSDAKQGDVLIYGKLDLPGWFIKPSMILQSDEDFRPGRYYLSAVEPGRITAHPNGPVIYIGSFHSDDFQDNKDEFPEGSMACINPQFLDIGQSHVHRAYPLVARPAGSIDDNQVLGYFPDETKSSTGDGGSSGNEIDDVTRKDKYPSLIFGGTWTSTDDVRYVFKLAKGSYSWGNVKLNWTKDGSSAYQEVEIPAPGVFVDLDNGLKVKVRFPEATNKDAVVSDIGDCTWTLSFPHAGKGWVNHSTDAIASTGLDVQASEGVQPSMHALFTGRWSQKATTVTLLFPDKLYRKGFSDGISDGDTVALGDTEYTFTSDTDTAETDGYVLLGATVLESLHNLAAKTNSSVGEAAVFVKEDSSELITCDIAPGNCDTVISGASFEVVGGTIKCAVVFDSSFTVLGIILDESAYTPISLGEIKVYVYAENASTEQNYACNTGTRLIAVVYDFAPDAVYDYNMGLHQEIAYYFPPVPAQAAGLFVNGVEMEEATLYPDNPTYAIGHSTLYWMEDATGKLPWPDLADGRDTEIDPAYDKTMTFYFVVGFQGATGPVTSLTPAPDSPIKLYTYGTNDSAVTGDLMIDASLDLKVVDSGETGYQVAKRGKGGNLLAGPVVEKIVAGPGIAITQTPGAPAGQGTVTITLDDETIRGHFTEVALENAKQEKLGLFPYISLLGWGDSNNIPSAFTMMLRVPSNLDDDKEYKLQLRLVMFGTTGYDNSDTLKVAGLQLEYNILPDYTDDSHLSLKNGLIVPDSVRDISVPFGHQEGGVYKYVAYDPFVATTDSAKEKENDVCVALSNLAIPDTGEFTGTAKNSAKLKPGYLVAVRISRTAPTLVNSGTSYAAYTAPVGFLSLEWTLEEAEKTTEYSSDLTPEEKARLNSAEITTEDLRYFVKKHYGVS